MAKFPPIPRLSIVVPVGDDLAAFESSLISVLENRPPGCEVIVPHDGRYDDPFDLCDEVRFVATASSQWVDLVAESVKESRGRFVHILSDGLRASFGWTDYALERFEHHDAATVCPVIRNSKTQQVIAAGWHDTSRRLCEAAGAGQIEIDPTTVRRFFGAYLQASFWRRNVLESLLSGFSGTDCTEATYALAHLAEGAGWRCLLADECEILCDSSTLPWDQSTFARGQRLRAIQSVCTNRGWRAVIRAATRAVVKNTFSPRHYAESLGQAVAPLAKSDLAGQMHPENIVDCSVDNVIKAMPRQRDVGIRRAA